MVVAYLRYASAVLFAPDHALDYFDMSKTIGTRTMRSDGVFVWPDYLAGYVEHYDVFLPEEFEEHMRLKHWTLPTAMDLCTLPMVW